MNCLYMGFTLRAARWLAIPPTPCLWPSVVIKNEDDGCIEFMDVVEGLEGETVDERPVADHRHDVRSWRRRSLLRLPSAADSDLLL